MRPLTQRDEATKMSRETTGNELQKKLRRDKPNRSAITAVAVAPAQAENHPNPPAQTRAKKPTPPQSTHPPRSITSSNATPRGARSIRQASSTTQA